MKLGSGLFDLYNLSTKNINTAIGTDSSASNNRLDMLSEIRSISLVSKALTMKSDFLKPAEIIKMATINGAKALGLENLIGSIKKNKYADLIAINIDTIETQPCFDPLSTLVYSADRNSIDYVWINGETKLNEKKLVCIDETTLLQKAKLWKNKIKKI
jgi:5-methylthioadenosine/S-adenosylhomocysteine deaminase